MKRFLPALTLACTCFSAAAQNPQPLPSPALNIQLDGTVHAMARQSDGDVVVGGEFTSINGIRRINLALIHPDGRVDAEWNPGADGGVESIVVGDDDTVYVGGWFDHAGGAPRNAVAKLRGDGDGAALPWDAALSGDSIALALEVDAGGALYVGGSFGMPDGDPVHAAKFAADAAPAWQIDVTQPGDVTRALELGAAGVLYLGGTFSDARGGTARDNLVKLATVDGSPQAWAPQPDGTVYALFYDGSNGALFVAGEFANIGGAARLGVARLDAGGTANVGWDANSNGPVHRMLFAHGGLYVAGAFSTIGGLARTEAAKLSVSDASVDAAWAPQFDGRFDSVRALEAFGAEVLVGGSFVRVGGELRLGLARLDDRGAPGASLDAERPGIVNAMAVQPDGGVVFGGEFYTVNGVPRRNLARMAPDGMLDLGWVADAEGFGGLPGAVRALAVHRVDGYVIVGGEFQSINGASVKHLAKLSGRDGALDAGFLPNPNGFVHALAFDPNFRLYVGGQFDALVDESNTVQTRDQLARFLSDGRLDPNWAPPVHGLVRALALGGVNVYVGGDLLLRKYNAGDASADPLFPDDPEGTITNIVTDGVSVYVGGSFNSVGGQSRHSLAKLDTAGNVDPDFVPATSMATAVDSLLLDDAGRLYVGGFFPEMGGQTIPNFVRLATATGDADPNWQPMPDGPVRALRRFADGTLLAGGQFGQIGGEGRTALAALGKLSQTITFGAAPGPFTYGDAGGTVNATASSGLAVGYGTGTPGVCEVNRTSGLITILSAGDCVIIAKQPGDDDYDSAPAQSQTITIAQAAQAALSVTATPSTVVVGATSALATTGGSGSGRVGFAVTAGGTNCSITGSTLTAIAAGTCTVTATREGDTNYLPATATVIVTVTAAPTGNAIFRDGFEN